MQTSLWCGPQALGLGFSSCDSWSTGSVAVALRPSCSVSPGVFPNQGLSPTSPCVGRRILPPSHLGKPQSLRTNF